jgi:hypothetical protein
MQTASWILHPADDQVLPATSQQHHLPLAALDEMDPTAGIEGDGFSQDQCSPGSGLRPPTTELEHSGCRADHGDNADQNAYNKQ